MPDRPAMAHRLEALTSYYAEAPPQSSPCETVVSGRAEVEQDANRRVIPQMSTASDPVEAEIQRRVALALAETQAVPDSPTPKTPPIVGVDPLIPMPVFPGLSQPVSSAQLPAPPLSRAPPGEPPMDGPAMGPVQSKAPPTPKAHFPADPAGQLTMQTAQSVFPLPAAQPFAMGQATSTPTPSSPTQANPSTRVMSAELLATMYSGSQPMAPPLLGRPSRIPQEGFLPEFRVDVAEAAEIVLPPNVESLHHWGLALAGFGKHKGSRYREICHGDPSYIRWLLRPGRHYASPAQLDFIKFSQAMNAQASAPHQPAPTPTPASASRAAPGAPHQL